MHTDTPLNSTDRAIREVAQRLLHDIDQEARSWRFTLWIARLFWLSMRLIIFIGPWITAVVATFAATMPSDHKGPWPWITFAIASFTAVAAQTIRDTRAFEYFQYRLKGWVILDDLRLRSGVRFAQAQENGHYEKAFDELRAELFTFRQASRVQLEEMYREVAGRDDSGRVAGAHL